MAPAAAREPRAARKRGNPSLASRLLLTVAPQPDSTGNDFGDGDLPAATMDTAPRLAAW